MLKRNAQSLIRPSKLSFQNVSSSLIEILTSFCVLVLLGFFAYILLFIFTIINYDGETTSNAGMGVHVPACFTLFGPLPASKC